MAISSSTKTKIANYAMDIIFSNEGSYNTVVANDNGAVSIGKIQWHGARALELMKTIVTKNKSNAKSVLGSTLYNEILSSSTSWASRTLTTSETKVVKTLLSTSESKTAQDALVEDDLLVYVNHAINLGMEDKEAIIYFCDLENQGGYGGSKRVATTAKSTAGSFAKITLSIIHTSALSDSVLGKYTTRRKTTKSAIEKLGLGSSTTTTATSTSSKYDSTKVLEFQKACNTDKVTDASGNKLTEDGNFGVNSLAAAKKITLKAIYDKENKKYVVGSTGALVEWFEKRMKALGYDITVNKKYGRGDRTVCNKYQNKKGLTITGEVDVKVIKKILKA